MKKEIEKILEKALEKLNFDVKSVKIEVDYPKNEVFGDYSTNVAMVLAKTAKRSPMEIANKINSQIATYDLRQFEKIEIAKPGYINFYLSAEYLRKKVEEINKLDGKYGDLENKEKTMIEYSQPNTHKEFHIGHLRNVIIGNTLVNVLKKAGMKVISANYIGDTGTHVSKCLWGLLKFHKNEDWQKVENKSEFLGKVYSESVRKIKENEEYEQEFKEIQRRFEKGDKEVVELWEKTRKFSLDEFEKMYKKLGVNFDVYFFESEEEREGKKMLSELLKTRVIKESDGAIIADLEKYNLGVLVLQRSDGAVLYGLKDIPLAFKKFREFKIDRSIYIVDIRQQLYFRQLFKILELAGLKNKMTHIEYDFVNLKGGERMSSREGNIVSASSLIDQVKNKVEKKFPESLYPEEISLSAIKFCMLKYSSASKIEFDIEESVKLEGVTGPYVQYAHARICSIIKKQESGSKNQEEKADLTLLTHEKELGLMRELNKFPELIEEIAEDCEVHKLPYYAIKLADKFHSFYNDLTVLDPENPSLTSARLKLVNAVRIVLAEALRLMGVNSPAKM